MELLLNRDIFYKAAAEPIGKGLGLETEKVNLLKNILFSPLYF